MTVTSLPKCSFKCRVRVVFPEPVPPAIPIRMVFMFPFPPKISQFCETKPRSFASIIEEALPKSKRNRGKSANFPGNRRFRS